MSSNSSISMKMTKYAAKAQELINIASSQAFVDADGISRSFDDLSTKEVRYVKRFINNAVMPLLNLIAENCNQICVVGKEDFINMISKESMVTKQKTFNHMGKKAMLSLAESLEWRSPYMLQFLDIFGDVEDLMVQFIRKTYAPITE